MSEGHFGVGHVQPPVEYDKYIMHISKVDFGGAATVSLCPRGTECGVSNGHKVYRSQIDHR